MHISLSHTHTSLWLSHTRTSLSLTHLQYQSLSHTYTITPSLTRSNTHHLCLSRFLIHALTHTHTHTHTHSHTHTNTISLFCFLCCPCGCNSGVSTQSCLPLRMATLCVCVNQATK